jgi:hypothetical protein
MSELHNALYQSGFESYGADFSKQPPNLDFFSFHSPSDILAPHPDLFESELDSSLAAFDEAQLQLLTVDSKDAFSILRSEATIPGPPSTFTVSSESTYDSYSAASESLYNFPNSPYIAQSNYSFPLDLELDFQSIHVDSMSEYSSVSGSQPAVKSTSLDASFGLMPISPDPAVSPRTGFERGSFSDYAPSSRASNTASDYYSRIAGSLVQSTTVSPASLVPKVPSVATPSPNDASEACDPKKKYKCSQCPRGKRIIITLFPFDLWCLTSLFLAFARAYNLKTHAATHDINRLKPHSCPHRSCGRSFSRKHDLGRHLVSIHQDNSMTPASHCKKAIGVEQGNRTWCDNCGKGRVGDDKDCDCEAT